MDPKMYILHIPCSVHMENKYCPLIVNDRKSVFVILYQGYWNRTQIYDNISCSLYVLEMQYFQKSIILISSD